MPHLSRDNIDLILNFVNKYHELYEKDQITEEQLNKISKVLDNFEDYPYSELQEKLNEFFDQS